ncbi:MAG: hypothetical protein M3R39_10250 [Actinomycetota bacterium]|nr:hypothetical protein [Actinomycetota bacterium]
MTRVTCPHCGQRFKSSKPESGNFELQGRSGGKAIIKCEDCGNGMLVGLIGKAQPIPAEAWAKHQAYMWEEFDSPEAQARTAAEVEEAVRPYRAPPPADMATTPLDADAAALMSDVLGGIPVPPGSTAQEIADQLADQMAAGVMQRVDETRERGLWTPDLQRLFDAIAELPDDADEGRQKEAVDALVTEIARVEREHDDSSG